MGSRFLLIALLSLSLTGCFSLISSEFESTGEGTRRNDPKDYMPVWTFMSTSTIESILRDRLAITGATAEEQELLTYLRDHRRELGDGNYAQGLADNARPEPGKFKYLIQIFADACYLGLAKPGVHSALFPNVTATSTWTLESFNAAYRALLGREPSQGEKEELLALVGRLPANVTPAYLKKTAGVCTVLLSSVEGANSR
ncbi:MAG TPA: hypothetical protein VFV50_00090 [Bdellovibrionales bacterium]|nr:hypothetical protein [Bdellovibrionales bacterium]